MPDKIRVLVVEDNEFDRELLQVHLRGEEFAADFACDGVEAWTILEQRADRYDLVLLDRTMPRMNGLELLGRMKRDPRCRTLPVILQTACVGREEMIEGIRAGAYYYLTKPYDSDVLLSVIRTAASDAHEIRELQKRLKRGLNVLALLSEAHFAIRTLDEARDLAGVLANACPDPDSAVVGLTELLVNAVEHGNLGITYEEKSSLRGCHEWEAEVLRRLELEENAAKKVDVQFKRDGGEIHFHIRDQGNGFEWNRYLDIDPRRAFDTHGRGILLARHFSFSALEYRGRGNEVTATVSLVGAVA
jgi:CheY-like chemotaxis protein/anti-sigma regulatory factor (Ser/Thr protein kinase)